MGDREIDQQLVERAQQGDKRAFELLVAKYQRKLARLLSRLVRNPTEVEDVSQEAFIKAYRALPSFRGDSAFYTWLYRLVSIRPRIGWLPIVIALRRQHFWIAKAPSLTKTASGCMTQTLPRNC
mgnify:CR=1 FL=1